MTHKQHREDILDAAPLKSHVEYLRRLFELEDADEASAIDTGQRYMALECAAKLVTCYHTEVITAANAYLSFLKGGVDVSMEVREP